MADDLTPCAFGDPSCPCQDGDPCHYVQHGDSPPMVPPPRDLAPSELLAVTAADMRAVADAVMRAVADAVGPGAAGRWTANLEAGDGYCIVESADYTFDAHMQVVAEHVAAWDPTMARAVADLLERVAQGHELDVDSVVNPATGQPWPLWAGTEPQDPDPRCVCGDPWVEDACATVDPALTVCEAWWASRYREPEAADGG